MKGMKETRQWMIGFSRLSEDCRHNMIKVGMKMMIVGIYLQEEEVGKPRKRGKVMLL